MINQNMSAWCLMMNLLVARGEVIVVNEKFAVRITDIISPDNRFEAL